MEKRSRKNSIKGHIRVLADSDPNEIELSMFLIALGLFCLFGVFTGEYIPPDLRGLAIPFSLGLIVLGVFLRSYQRDEDEDIRKRNNEEKAREERERADWWNDQR